MPMHNAMKSFSLPLLFCLVPCVQAAVMPPPSAAGYTISFDLYQAQQCSTEMYQEPTGYWTDMPRTPLRLEFPDNGCNRYTAPHPHNNTDNTWPDIKISYTANEGYAYVKVENPSFSTLIVMEFTDSSAGTARIYLHENGLTHHMRHVTFSMVKDAAPIEPVTLPEPDECDGDPQLLDEGLSDILVELETRTYTSATDKLYQKRLLMLLPRIQVLHDVNLTTPETKGNTALHYACGLSHVKLVQWLIDHGADTEAVTDKGATADACIGGKNASSVKKILTQARADAAAGIRKKETSEQAAAAAGQWLETAFRCKDITADTADIPTIDPTARRAAETLYRFYTSNNMKHPFGVHELSRMGRMLTWASHAKLTETEFVDTVQQELREARLYHKQLRTEK